MKAIDRTGRAAARAGRAADAFQQRQPVLAFPVAVWKKFNDDRAGNLAALIAYYGFVAIFPLLLVLVTVLNILLKNDPALQKTLTNSALAQYPVIGTADQARIWGRSLAPACPSSSAPSCCCSAPGASPTPCRTRCSRSGAFPARAVPAFPCHKSGPSHCCSLSASGSS